MKEVPVKVYDWIFWMSLSVVFIWMVLKAIGIINTPEWQELVPLAGAIFAGGAFYQKVNTMEKKLEHIDKDTNQLKLDMSVVKTKLNL